VLDTDLPDQTDLMVSVDRHFRTREDSETYSVEYFSAKTKVGEWRTLHAITLDDAEWGGRLDDRQRMLSQLGEPFSVRTISDQIEIDFVVPMIQDPPFTRWNANLRGGVVTVDEDGRRLIQRTISIPKPFHSEGVGQTHWADPLNLKLGTTYRLAKRTPLMPELEPVDPLKAIEDIRQMEVGTLVRVIAVQDLRNSPWYHVTVRNGSQAGATGWINSIALLGQDIAEVR
jgi:hypothetical protein